MKSKHPRHPRVPQQTASEGRWRPSPGLVWGRDLRQYPNRSHLQTRLVHQKQAALSPRNRELLLCQKSVYVGIHEDVEVLICGHLVTPTKLFPTTGRCLFLLVLRSCVARRSPRSRSVEANMAETVQNDQGHGCSPQCSRNAYLNRVWRRIFFLLFQVHKSIKPMGGCGGNPNLFVKS